MRRSAPLALPVTPRPIAHALPPPPSPAPSSPQLSLSPGGIALIPEVPSPMERDSGTGQPPDLLLDPPSQSRGASRCDSTRSGHRSRALSRTHPGHTSTPRKPGSPFPEPEETILAAAEDADPVEALVSRLNSKLMLRSRQASRTSPGSKRGARGEGEGSGSSSGEDTGGSSALVLPLGQGRLSSFSRNPRQIPVEGSPIVARKSSRFRKFLGPN